MKASTKNAIKQNITGYLFASPWLLGFLIFMAVPICLSLYYSLTYYVMPKAPKFIGFTNYVFMFTKDPLFWKSLYNTLYYVVIGVPAGLVVGLAVAVLMNQKVGGIKIYRTIFYLPNVVSLVAVSILWQWVFDTNFGLINTTLQRIGIDGPGWLTDAKWAKLSLIIMSLWYVGSSMIIYLAALQDVPRSLYESAYIDGASSAVKFFQITLPMITPSIFFNVIMGIIGGFQVFTQALIMTGGNPGNSTLFYAYHLYNKAFYLESSMGYGSAMAWFLLVITFILTVIIVKTSNMWVYYEDGGNK